MPPKVSAPPAAAAKTSPVTEEAAPSTLAAASPPGLDTSSVKGLFRNDFLAFCKQLGAQVHSQLLPSAILSDASAAQSAIPRPRWQRAADIQPHDGDHPEDLDDVAAGGSAPLARHAFDFTVREEVRVAAVAIQPDTFVAFLGALRFSSHTTRVALHGAALSAAQLFDLSEVLPHTQISELCIDYNALEPGSAVYQPPTPPAPPPPPVEAAPPAGKKGAAAAAAVDAPPPEPPKPAKVHVWSLFLRRGQPISKLSLRGNALGPADAAALASPLALNTSCADLNLSDNVLGDAGIAALCTGLRENRSLRCLSLAGNAITPAWCVSSTLKQFPVFALTPYRCFCCCTVR